MIIDPPVTVFHPAKDIEEWLETLRAMPSSKEVAFAIAEAEEWLKRKERKHST